MRELPSPPPTTSTSDVLLVAALGVLASVGLVAVAAAPQVALGVLAVLTVTVALRRSGRRDPPTELPDASSTNADDCPTVCPTRAD